MDRKALIREYKNTHRQMGVFQVKNRINGKLLIGSSPNLPGILNRLSFSLKTGTCPNKALQADWNAFGPEAFEFSVLEELAPLDDPTYVPGEDLELLKSLWLEKLAPYGDRGYNKKQGKQEIA